jgi:hypothetical protein
MTCAKAQVNGRQRTLPSQPTSCSARTDHTGGGIGGEVTWTTVAGTCRSFVITRRNRVPSAITSRARATR